MIFSLNYDKAQVIQKINIGCDILYATNYKKDFVGETIFYV